MSQADVIALASLLGGGLADVTSLQRFYTDVVLDLGNLDLLVQLTLIDHDVGQAVFDSPPSTLRLLAITYDDVVCSRVTRSELEAIDPAWRAHRGSPVAFTTETEGDRRFRLYPEPAAPSGPFIPKHGDLLGRDFPKQAIGVLATQSQADVPLELELPVALLVLARAFAIESKFQDQVFAKSCFDLGAQLLTAVVNAG